ncbi:hypothetical protein CDO73_04670 [Saccharibacillus sp. O23]|uniref:hypothetical protein n=1 Tax=Saccharibacillus sp. O23 TaxID=2009338 RepID=UPI000B4E5C37|nr:hypothetical protein [Saccharibacillus sp. O23]OWR31778.1 hypothetical protein CDO73_04670 [Saccharibacillus sp. O23]
MKKSIMLLALLLLLLAGCSREEPSKTVRNDFMAWMDTYAAVEKGESNRIAVTLFFDKGKAPYDADDIVNVAFQGLAEEVVVDKFDVSPNQVSPGEKYGSYSMILDYTAHKIGQFRTPGIVVLLGSGQKVTYPVGQWTFDVDQADAGWVDTWSSPAASSNPAEFPYEYALNDPKAKILQINYGPHDYIKSDKGLPLQSSIDMSSKYDAPIVFVKSKIRGTMAGKPFVGYGKGMYCGALSDSDDSEDVIEQSKKHNVVY